MKKLLFLAGFLSLATTPTMAYEITVNNQAVVFNFINITCNGGKINDPPRQIPTDQSISFSVQSDAQLGCMLRYRDNKDSILGIWIHQHQVDCSNEGSIFSYDCKFQQNSNTLTISQ
jgi:hypothetical protein